MFDNCATAGAATGRGRTGVTSAARGELIEEDDESDETADGDGKEDEDDADTISATGDIAVCGGERVNDAIEHCACVLVIFDGVDGPDM